MVATKSIKTRKLNNQTIWADLSLMCCLKTWNSWKCWQKVSAEC